MKHVILFATLIALLVLSPSILLHSMIVLLSIGNILRSMLHLQVCRVHFNWKFSQRLLLPLVWRQVGGGFSNGHKGSLGKVTHGRGASLGGSINVFIPSKV